MLQPSAVHVGQELLAAPDVTPSIFGVEIWFVVRSS